MTLLQIACDSGVWLVQRLTLSLYSVTYETHDKR
jgi:hypothetical protein